MRDGFIKVAAGIPQMHLADVSANTNSIKKIITKADGEKVNLLVLPELCITGYTCGDLFFNDSLISSARASLLELAEFTKGKYPVVVVGLPFNHIGKLYNCAAAIHNGEILGIVPKTYLPNHCEFNEQRYFQSPSALTDSTYLMLNDEYETDFGKNLIFMSNSFSFGIEICEDLFAPEPINQRLALAGAQIIVNPAACNQTVGKAEYCKSLIKDATTRLNCGYVLASSDIGESSTDTVYGGLAFVYENGKLLNESKPFANEDLVITEIDVKLLNTERQKNTSFKHNVTDFRKIYFEQESVDTKLTRSISKSPFLPNCTNLNDYFEEILQIQSNALARRFSHTHSKTAVIGISGGLDSTLALLVAVRAMKLLNRPLTDVSAITMPCFGTTNRTRSNSQILCEELGVSFKEINITAAVTQHFKDIGQNIDTFDVTFENSQARERTQVLMDLANKENGMVIGTGDLSELALGWATYNGDHMSMYGVNSGVPKTLIRHIVRYEAENSDGALKTVLFDILDTPVSPELLPTDDNGDIAQKTEDLVGPYELHDFFLYYMLRYGFSPAKIFRLCVLAFENYDKETILKWLKTFTRRFFTQQFKRSCLPDGPKISDISLSPRGDLKMPTDASFNLWLKELEDISI